MTCEPLPSHHTVCYRVCYPRDTHAPKRHGLPEIQSKTCTQEVCPRHTHLLSDRHVSWTCVLGCNHTSWVTCPFTHVSWVTVCLLGCVGLHRCSALMCDIMTTSHQSTHDLLISMGLCTMCTSLCTFLICNNQCPVL